MPVKRTLLISDANVVIDIVDGNLLTQMFSLEYGYGMPDLLFEDELRERHPELPEAGLQLLALNEAAINDANLLYGKYRKNGTSVYDCMALSLARQYECPLLSGDGAIRQASMIENIPVRGTLWLIEEMLRTGVIRSEQAKDAYATMQERGSRLPWDEVEKQISQYAKK